MAGRYTAYHVYQDLSFTEADRAATPPYKLPEYHCAHSQRGYLFQFGNMAERNHFDAANTTCCDEPVLNFQNKPQFASVSKPMRPRDCSPRIRINGCETLEVSIEDSTGMCATQSARVRRIRIKCPSVCAEFSEIRNSGSLKGQYGTFRALGLEAEEVLILDYTPDPQIINNIYKSCSGVATFTEEFCNGRSLSYEVRAGLDFPGDCGCDCCGELGKFPAPNMYLTAPDIIDGGPENRLSPNISISGAPACRGGTIDGTFYGAYGATAVSWPKPAVYHSDGVSRAISRELPVVGDVSNPACCGGKIEWIGDDGCGALRHGATVVSSNAQDMSVLPADGTILHENDPCSFTGQGACSYSNAAELDLETVCLDNSLTTLYRYDTALVRNVDLTLKFQDSHECGGCCGHGMINLSFANGCGSSMTASYPVKRPISQAAYQETIGRVFRCERFFRDFTPIGYFYRVATADLRCDGSLGEFSNPFPGYYVTLEECLTQIAGSTAPAFAGPIGCGGVIDGADCCFYSDNGLSGLEFMSRIVSVSGSRCCVIDTTNGAWINGGPNNGCCPN